MPIYEGIHTGEHMLSEANGTLSREEVIFAPLAEALESGTVVAKITKAGTATATAYAGNTGNGAMGTITVGAGAKQGNYRLTIIEPGTNVGTFVVEDPDGVEVGRGNVAAAFSGGGLGFTLADGATDFIAGDGFVIAVAAGSGKWAPYDDDATNGTEVAAGVLYTALPASASDQKAVVHVRQTEVSEARLTGIDAAGKADLAALGIIVR